MSHRVAFMTAGFPLKPKYGSESRLGVLASSMIV